jgi:hypothetical protein
MTPLHVAPGTDIIAQGDAHAATFYVLESGQCEVSGEGGGMEGWRDGGMEGWRDGGMEGWMRGGGKAGELQGLGAGRWPGPAARPR